MANEILVKDGTPVVWADTTDYSDSDNFTRTHQIDLTSLAATKARQGAKADLGATRARQYAVKVAIEWGAAQVAGKAIEFYWSASHSDVAATGNDAGASGSDAAWRDGTEAIWKKQAIYLGSLIANATGAGTVQRQTIGIFSPPMRYGQPIALNMSAQALDSDATNMYIALVPITDESQ